MRFHDDEKTALRVNEHVSLRGIPAAAHTYQVNGRTPLEWFIDRYRITQDKESGIVNDPNGWFDDPRDLIAAIRRIVHVSVETARIVTGLPEPMRAVSQREGGLYENLEAPWRLRFCWSFSRARRRHLLVLLRGRGRMGRTDWEEA